MVITRKKPSSKAAAVEAGLPEELMTLILSKLPVKSLLRFKCVQKSWYSLIKSRYFTHLHRYSSSSTSSSINYDCFIVTRSIQQPRRHVLSFNSYETLDDLGNEINLPISSSSSSRSGVSVCGSCDGLVCLTNKEDQILICNPTIREFRSLVFPPPLGIGSGFSIDSIAFGSVPNTGQYAVLMIGVPFEEKYKYGKREVRLYDFKTDTWRKTAAIFPRDGFHCSPRAISFNGAFHWSPYNGKSILTFDMRNEVMTENIPLPHFFVHVYNPIVLCVSSKSQLSLISHNHKGRFEIWVMTEYGVKESWTRLFNMLFNIGPLPNIPVPLAFWDEQQLLVRTKQKQLVLFDLLHQNLRHFPIDGDFDVYPYSQSLVSVNGI